MSDKLNHIAFIMDGNRRWARKRRLPLLYGHRQGGETLQKVIKWLGEIGVKYCTVYAFSTENWKRSKEEIHYMMELLVEYINKYLGELNKNGVKVIVSGRINKFPKRVREAVEKVVQSTKNNKKGVLNIALSYGGRAEIVDAVKKIISKKIPKDKVTEKVLSSNMYHNIPEPDLIIRTGGQMRLSNFLLWQSAYSELYFTKVLWPDFSKKDLLRAIENYRHRKRNFGK